MFPYGHQFHSKDDPRQKYVPSMKLVENCLFRSFLKRDSSVSDSEKKIMCST